MKTAKLHVLRPLLFLGILVALSLPSLQGESRPGISGTIFIIAHERMPLARAKVTFQTKDGRAIEANLKNNGDYEAYLTEEGEYTALVTSPGLCPVHRPPFVWKRGVSIKFDFTMVQCPNINIMTSHTGTETEDERANGVMYYKEQHVSFGHNASHYLIVAFGFSQRADSGIRYHAYDSSVGRSPIFPSELPEGRLPVLIMFASYTIQATSVTFYEDIRSMKAEGNVLIADGSTSPPRSVSCMILRLDRSEPEPESCQ
jgi:hypothetical protein